MNSRLGSIAALALPVAMLVTLAGFTAAPVASPSPKPTASTSPSAEPTPPTTLDVACADLADADAVAAALGVAVTTAASTDIFDTRGWAVLARGGVSCVWAASDGVAASLAIDVLPVAAVEVAADVAAGVDCPSGSELCGISVADDRFWVTGLAESVHAIDFAATTAIGSAVLARLGGVAVPVVAPVPTDSCEDVAARIDVPALAGRTDVIARGGNWPAPWTAGYAAAAEAGGWLSCMLFDEAYEYTVLFYVLPRGSAVVDELIAAGNPEIPVDGARRAVRVPDLGLLSEKGDLVNVRWAATTAASPDLTPLGLALLGAVRS
ncbi:hypothetical protein [Schumannella soli]|uniref:DUF3558 domain-containing protein n=1 Tax=Schumannella soli TaxID=2590779 RepID=A0A506XWE1_9MICO|nr:hypothetical protein [Schumannella soli]TPW77224.1 hypothetical protein FJ657_00490 [Schumannella soli]